VLSGAAFSANGKLLAISLSPFGQSSSMPGAVIWAVATHRIVGKLPPDTGGGGLAFSPERTGHLGYGAPYLSGWGQALR